MTHASSGADDAVVCSTLGMFIMDMFDFGSDRPPIPDQVGCVLMMSKRDPGHGLIRK